MKTRNRGLRELTLKLDMLTDIYRAIRNTNNEEAKQVEENIRAYAEKYRQVTWRGYRREP